MRAECTRDVWAEALFAGIDPSGIGQSRQAGFLYGCCDASDGKKGGSGELVIRVAQRNILFVN
jgi:hypothetical protein